MKCESRSSRYYVIDVGAKKLTLQCYAGKLTPLDDSNTRVENSSWHCLKITTKCLITIYERSELRLLLDLFIGALKSPLRYLVYGLQRWNHHYDISTLLISALKSPIILGDYYCWRLFIQSSHLSSSSVIFPAMNITLFKRDFPPRMTWFSLNARSLSDDMRLCLEVLKLNWSREKCHRLAFLQDVDNGSQAARVVSSIAVILAPRFQVMVMNNQTFRNVVIQWCCLVPLMIEQLMCGSSVMQGTDSQASPPRYLCSTNPEKTPCWLRAWHMEKVSCSPRLVTVAQLFTTINHLVKDLQLWYIFKKSTSTIERKEKKLHSSPCATNNWSVYLRKNSEFYS